MLGDAAEELDECSDFFVWPDNWDALIVFLASDSQWRYAPSGNPSGLDYTGVQVVMQMQATKDIATTFEGVQIMEKEVLRVWSEQ
jgi:hypothetical protein